ncbi:putative G-type lectin S-receptor-like serine/threonine-protein kinase At1g61610 [Setaria italica]|nr:putative G-type lectin S-receptor-like serine/threonine-protein kinase At1g61610 [Setaria italica]
MLWQSFDHPSDTFLPDMRIRVSRGGRAGDRLVSWKSPGDPSPGGFTYGIDPVTSLQLFTWNGSSPLWRSGVWTGYRVASDFIEETGAVVLLTVLDLKDDASMSFDIRPPVTRTRYVMSYSGELVLQSWNNASLEWDELGVWPPHGCSRYGYCGAFGYCDNTVAAPTCKCLDGFAPASPEEWSSGRFSSGCRRKEELRCGDGDGFLPLPAMKAPDRFVVVGNRSLDECAAECRRNCSCVAFAYANLSSSAKGDPTRCLVWVGELIDAEKIGGNVAGSETLHLRLAGLAKGRRMGRKTLKTALLVLAGILLTCIFLLILWICKCKGIKQKRRKHRILVLGDLSDPKGFGEGSPTEGYEFPVVSFRDIIAATDNFHESCMIGKGGFGKVYKANLDGQEVAIKRLSRDSEQGIVEFRNEVVLIAKLQHRNLVKFLGCSIEGDEKLLIFEHMPNKSLDALLFSATRKTRLDWPTRFNIIKGVAKGLLYLHQDSRLKIIHRDLKASNILLDEDMRPKIADFGMARMFSDNQQNANTKRVAGTYGYMAPEYAMRGVFSAKSDVYSFGVLVLELVSGVKISSTDQIMEFEDLIDYAWNLWKDGKAKNLLDLSIVESCVPNEVLLCVHIGLLCVQDNPNDRPLMSSVLFVLENGSTTLPIPKKPVYFAHRNNEVEQGRGNSQSSKNSVTLSALDGR